MKAASIIISFTFRRADSRPLPFNWILSHSRVIVIHTGIQGKFQVRSVYTSPFLLRPT